MIDNIAIGTATSVIRNQMLGEITRLITMISILDNRSNSQSPSDFFEKITLEELCNFREELEEFYMVILKPNWNSQICLQYTEFDKLQQKHDLIIKLVYKTIEGMLEES